MARIKKVKEPTMAEIDQMLRGKSLQEEIDFWRNYLPDLQRRIDENHQATAKEISEKQQRLADMEDFKKLIGGVK